MSECVGGRPIGRTEPIRVVVEEVAVTVGRACVAIAVSCRQRRSVGRIRRVEVQRVRGLVFDVNVQRAAIAVRAVLNCTDLAHWLHQIETTVPPRARTRARWLRVPLEKVGAVAHLVVEAVVVAVAGRRVGASCAHRRTESIVGRPRVGDKPLLLLKHDEQCLLAHTAGTGDFVDDRGSRLVRGPLV